MPSSKVFRKGRWIWGCSWENNASCWKDFHSCGARSRLSYSTQQEALRAGKQHQYRTNHNIKAWQIR